MRYLLLGAWLLVGLVTFVAFLFGDPTVSARAAEFSEGYAITTILLAFFGFFAWVLTS